MKKLFKATLSVLLIALLAISLISCENDVTHKTTSEQEPTRKEALLDYAVFQDYKMTEEEVESSLLNFLTVGNASKGLDASSFSIKKIEEGAVPLEGNCVSKALASAEQDDITFSVYEVENKVEEKSGFAITSDDKRIGDVLCYIEDGAFSADLSDNPAMEIFAACLEDYVNETQDIWNSITDEEIQALKDEYGITDEDIQRAQEEIDNSKAKYSYGSWYLSRGDRNKALIKTKWNQNPNTYYTKIIQAVYGQPYYAGCSTVATAQLMAYWKYPKRMSSSVLPTVKTKDWVLNRWNGEYDWNAMINGQSRTLVGALMYEVAEGIGVNYGVSGTSGRSENQIKYLKRIGYKQGSTGDKDDLYSSIDNNRPVLVSGYATKEKKKKGWWIFSKTTTTYKDGHAWIIDGYYEQTRNVTKKKKILFWTKTSRYTETELYVHCNFGWSGVSDGWYKYGVFDTAGGNFQYQIGMNCNLYPGK